ncbi:MAG: hypothetical protein LC793_20630 [Thermomicrobia bacterium]|nr:hypothetical protein [Thermomicrobia bacterium]
MRHLEIALEGGLIVVEIERLALPGEVVERALLLRVADLLLDDAAWAPALAVLLGLLCGLLAEVAAVAPRVHVWYEAVGAGIALGLSAAGLYSGSKAMLAPAQGHGTDSA